MNLQRPTMYQESLLHLALARTAGMGKTTASAEV
jgi:hypothetical protein